MREAQHRTCIADTDVVRAERCHGRGQLLCSSSFERFRLATSRHSPSKRRSHVFGKFVGAYQVCGISIVNKQGESFSDAALRLFERATLRVTSGNFLHGRRPVSVVSAFIGNRVAHDFSQSLPRQRSRSRSIARSKPVPRSSPGMYRYCRVCTFRSVCERVSHAAESLRSQACAVSEEVREHARSETTSAAGKCLLR